MAKKGAVETITETAAPEEKEFQGSGVEGEKTSAPEEEPKIITCADVIESLRAKGHRI